MRTVISLILFFVFPPLGLIVAAFLFLEWCKKKSDIDSYAKGIKKAKEKGYFN